MKQEEEEQGTSSVPTKIQPLVVIGLMAPNRIRAGKKKAPTISVLTEFVQAAIKQAPQHTTDQHEIEQEQIESQPQPKVSVDMKTEAPFTKDTKDIPNIQPEPTTSTNTEILTTRLEEQQEINTQQTQEERSYKYGRFSSNIPLNFLQAFCQEHEGQIPDSLTRHITIWLVLMKGDKVQSLLLDYSDGHQILPDPIALSIAVHG